MCKHEAAFTRQKINDENLARRQIQVNFPSEIEHMVRSISQTSVKHVMPGWNRETPIDLSLIHI